MLSDDQLDSLADAYARESVQLDGDSSSAGVRVIAHRRFALDAPAGVYYTHRLEPERKHGGLVGSGGFFIDRDTGNIIQFGSGEVLYTAAALASKAGTTFDGEIGEPTIRYLLTHPRDDALLQRGFAAFLGAPTRRWLDLWK